MKTDYFGNHIDFSLFRLKTKYVKDYLPPKNVHKTSAKTDRGSHDL